MPSQQISSGERADFTSDHVTRVLAGIDIMSCNGQWITCLSALSAVLNLTGCGSTLVDSGSPAANSRNSVIQNPTSISMPAMTVGQEKANFDSRNILRVPASSVVTLPTRRKEAFYHEVKKGETLSKIARQYGMPVWKLIEANGLETTSILQPKQLLYIPGQR